MRFENNSKMIVIYVILTVYIYHSENSITNSACVAKISILEATQISNANTVCDGIFTIIRYVYSQGNIDYDHL